MQGSGPATGCLDECWKEIAGEDGLWQLAKVEFEQARHVAGIGAFVVQIDVVTCAAQTPRKRRALSRPVSARAVGAGRRRLATPADVPELYSRRSWLTLVVLPGTR